MKRLSAVFLILATFLCLAPAQPVHSQSSVVQPPQDPQSIAVYVTGTGKKYDAMGAATCE